MLHLRRRVLATLLLGALAAPGLVAQSTYQQRGNNLPPVPKDEFTPLPRRFDFTDSASDDLHTLWNRSVAAGREMVGCMAGQILSRDLVRITKVRLLESNRGDSLGVSAQASIDQCGPPSFAGTVHTHIAHWDGEHPYAKFSGADRGVMFMWWKEWQVDGMFCVLYSPTLAYCEMLGRGGPSKMSRGEY